MANFLVSVQTDVPNASCVFYSSLHWTSYYVEYIFFQCVRWFIFRSFQSLNFLSPPPSFSSPLFHFRRLHCVTTVCVVQRTLMSFVAWFSKTWSFTWHVWTWPSNLTPPISSLLIISLIIIEFAYFLYIYVSFFSFLGIFLIEDIVAESWVEVADQPASPAPSDRVFVPHGPEDYLRLLREAQRDSNQSSALVSLASTRKNSPHSSWVFAIM